MTCTDQETAEVGKEPLITLKEFRSSAALGWDMGNSSVFFGWNIVPKVQGPLHINDDIQIITRRTAHVALPTRRHKAQAVPQGKAQDRGTMLKEGLWAALQGAATAVAVASVLICLMYWLIKSTAPEEHLVEPT